MRFEQFESEAEVAVAAADLLTATVHACAESRVILPAGRSPLRFYAEVVRRSRAGELDLAHVRFFQLDEYLDVAPSDARSFRSLLEQQLLSPLGRGPGQDELLDGTAKDPRAEIERHAERLAQLGGADAAFLGIGRNGHVAFNEPNATLDYSARVVPLARETRIAAEAEFGTGKAPLRGMTLGMREIVRAGRLVLLATGAAKSAIVAALFDEPPSSQRPASLLLHHPDFTLLTDVAAASALHTPLAAGAGRRRSAASGRGAG